MTDAAEPPSGRPGRKWLKIAGIVLLVAVVALLALRNPPTLERLRDWIESVGPWAPLVFILLHASRGVTWIPGSVLGPLGGASFGFWPGLAYSWIGFLIGCAIAFAVARLLGRDLVSEERRAVFDRFMQRAGGRVWLAVFLARLLPGLPQNVTSYAAGGLTNIGWGPYLLATAPSIVPRMAIQIAIGAGFYAAVV